MTSNCIWCGHETDNETHHYHGSVGSCCRYGNCQSSWQNFKYRLAKYKESKFQEVKEFAFIVEYHVFTLNEPALLWNDQLVSLRKLQKKLPLLRPVINIK